MRVAWSLVCILPLVSKMCSCSFVCKCTPELLPLQSTFILIYYILHSTLEMTATKSIASQQTKEATIFERKTSYKWIVIKQGKNLIWTVSLVTPAEYLALIQLNTSVHVIYYTEAAELLSRIIVKFHMYNWNVIIEAWWLWKL